MVDAETRDGSSGTVETAQLTLCFDDSGHAYGASPLVGLVRFDPVTGSWSESPEIDISLDYDARPVFPSAQGAFAIGRGRGETILAFKSDAAGEWRALPGLPVDAQSTNTDNRVAGGVVGRERALVVWTNDEGAEPGVWASFVE